MHTNILSLMMSFISYKCVIYLYHVIKVVLFSNIALVGTFRKATSRIFSAFFETVAVIRHPIYKYISLENEGAFIAC